MGSKESVKRAIRQKAMDPGIKKTAKMPKNDEEDNSESCSFKESKHKGPTEDEANMGEKDAAEGTTAMYIQMGAKAFAKQSHHLYGAAKKLATNTHKANMASEENHGEMDPQGYPHKTGLL